MAMSATAQAHILHMPWTRHVIARLAVVVVSGNLSSKSDLNTMHATCQRNP
jgi:hypothetical protein